MTIGLGVLQGLLVTLRHFVESVPGALAAPKEQGVVRQEVDQKGVFTVQYPEERLDVPERLRYFPVLLTENGEERCTSCGICAKVCPPQCIWIVRTTDEHGKPVPAPKDFVIDTSICMSCGFCAEYCPFDAIKMDHRYELGAYDRHESLILHKDRLLVPVEYYARIRPTDYAEEEEERRKKEEAERRRAEAKAKAAAAKASAAADRPAAKPGARPHPGPLPEGEGSDAAAPAEGEETEAP